MAESLWVAEVVQSQSGLHPTECEVFRVSGVGSGLTGVPAVFVSVIGGWWGSTIPDCASALSGPGPAARIECGKKTAWIQAFAGMTVAGVVIAHLGSA